MDLVFAKNQLVQKHTDSMDSPTTAVFLENRGMATCVGVFSFDVKETFVKIVNFGPGDACIANDAFRKAIVAATGLPTDR